MRYRLLSEIGRERFDRYLREKAQKAGAAPVRTTARTVASANALAAPGVDARALGSQPGKFILEKPLEVSRINPDKTAPGPDDIEVQVVRGDDVFAESGWPSLDLIKLDVEGAVLGILRGLAGVLQRHRPALILEIHGPYLPMFGASGEEVVEWLRAQAPARSWIQRRERRFPRRCFTSCRQGWSTPSTRHFS